MEKVWQVASPVDKKTADAFPEIHPVVLQLLYNRGLLSQEKIDQFLNSDYGDDLHDPFLFADMEKAVKRILEAVESQEKIVVYGDYDADGVSSSAVMVEMLKKLGANIYIYIPFRETEGYGMNKKAVTELADQGAKLLITVDNGISNAGEVEVLNERAVDVIITDHHHQPPVVPKAFAIINPNVEKEKYPFKFLTGAGVAFKVSQALALRHKNYKVKQLEEGWEKWLLDLVAIGTVADMQPLLDENRVLVKYGLIVLEKTKRPGLIELLKNKDGEAVKISENTIGWYIAPRLNAAGRMNHASTAYELLITQDETEAKKIVTELNTTNKNRQDLTAKILEQASSQVGQVTDQKILIAVGQDWPTGVVGLVAGRLTDRLHLPSLVISKFNGKIIGSGRSIREFNIIEAVEDCQEFLAQYGGHPQATGFTLKDEASLEKFIEKMTKLAAKNLKTTAAQPILEIETEISLEQVNWELFEDLEKFEPFGEKNPRPKFLAQNLTVVETQTMGKEGSHLKALVKHNSDIIRKTIGFSFGHWDDKLKPGDKVDMVFEVDVNQWNGNRELQLKIIDLKKKN